jgi:hypothetical protein
MLLRWICSGIILFWALATAWLIRHDVIPAITARDIPRMTAKGWRADGTYQSQARIEDKTGRRIGTTWMIHHVSDTGISRTDIYWIEHLGVLPPLRIQMDSSFTPDGVLDEIQLNLEGAGTPVTLNGENISGNFAFQLKVGKQEHLFKIDSALAGMLGNVFKPFPALPRIEVGQSWRMHVVNPLAAVTGVGSKLIPMIVRVTSREKLATAKGPVECFVVESDHGARAWVDDDGNVLRQEANIPIGGKLTIVAEPFDPKLLDEALAAPLGN